MDAKKPNNLTKVEKSGEETEEVSEEVRGTDDLNVEEPEAIEPPRVTPDNIYNIRPSHTMQRIDALERRMQRIDALERRNMELEAALVALRNLAIGALLFAVYAAYTSRKANGRSKVVNATSVEKVAVKEVEEG